MDEVSTRRRKSYFGCAVALYNAVRSALPIPRKAR